jgi:hypothetical protein
VTPTVSAISAVVQPIGCAQDDLGALRIGARDLAASDTSVEHSPLIGTEFDPARLSTCHHRPRIAGR